MRQEALVGGAALGQRYGCEDRSVEGAAHAQAHGPEELRILIESSREHGTLEAPEHELLTAMLAVQNATVSQVMTPAGLIATVPRSRPAGRSNSPAATPAAPGSR